MKKIIISILFIFAGAYAAHAVVAFNKPVTVTQPDGTLLTIRLHGDEFLHWTTCGNSLVAKGHDGYWHYSTFSSDGASPALGTRVLSDMDGDGSGITPPASAIEMALQKRRASTQRQNGAPALSNGDRRFLILLIAFSDKKFTLSKDYFTNLLSGDNYTYNGATGSVNRYYRDVSFGKFNPQFDVYGPIQVPYTSAKCAEDALNAVVYACTYADEYLGVDFSQYCNEDASLVDNVFFFFPGYNQAEGGGSDTIWPHAATYGRPFLTLDGVGIYKYGCASEFQGNSGQTMAGIGTFCHEFGHVIGLPDFYDVDYSENGAGNALDVLSLMSAGNYNNQGRTPPYFTYEEKHILGWDEGLIPLVAGLNTLEKTSTNKSYYSPTTVEGEYYIYESRPCEGWDQYTYAPGMAIYHIDKSNYVMPDGRTAGQLWQQQDMINAFASHQCMDLVETVYPESQIKYYQEEVFPGLNNVTEFTSSTVPGALAWSGLPTGYDLKGISFDSASGRTTFTVSVERKLMGTVSNTSHQCIANAEITVTYLSSVAAKTEKASPAAGRLSMLRLNSSPDAPQYKTLSDANGRFEFDIEQPGVYSLSVSKEGYLPYLSNVTIDRSQELNIIVSTPIDGSTTVLQKYNEISGRSAGYGAGVDHYGGLRYSAGELDNFAGCSINAISFMVANGGNGKADKLGVKVYFDDSLQCDCECTEPVYNTLCTVDISRFGLKVPSGRSVTFVYYVLNPTYDYPMVLADYNNPVQGANLVDSSSNLNWLEYDGGNVVLSASVVDNSRAVNLSGITFIPRKQSYIAGETFNLSLAESSVKPVSSVSWTVNGNPASGSVKLEEGVCVVKAFVTYESGRTEVIETKLDVKAGGGSGVDPNGTGEDFKWGD